MNNQKIINNVKKRYYFRESYNNLPETFVTFKKYRWSIIPSSFQNKNPNEKNSTYRIFYVENSDLIKIGRQYSYTSNVPVINQYWISEPVMDK